MHFSAEIILTAILEEPFPMYFYNKIHSNVFLKLNHFQTFFLQ